MPLPRAKLLVLNLSLPLALCACASSPAPVGRVVVAPQVALPPVPTLVQQTLPKPTGYFQSQTLDALAR